MLLDELHSKKDEVISLAKKYGATDVRVFGSVSRREENEESDVDILVSMPKGYDMFKERIPLQEELTRIFGRNVDLLVQHELNQHLKSIILAESKDL